MAFDAGGRGSHKAGEGQMTAGEVCSKCSPIKIIISQITEFVLILTQKLIFEKKVLLFQLSASKTTVERSALLITDVHSPGGTLGDTVEPCTLLKLPKCSLCGVMFVGPYHIKIQSKDKSAVQIELGPG